MLSPHNTNFRLHVLVSVLRPARAATTLFCTLKPRRRACSAHGNALPSPVCRDSQLCLRSENVGSVASSCRSRHYNQRVVVIFPIYKWLFEPATHGARAILVPREFAAVALSAIQRNYVGYKRLLSLYADFSLLTGLRIVVYHHQASLPVNGKVEAMT